MNSFSWICLIFLVSCNASGTDVDIHSMLRQLDMEENDPDVPQSEKNKLDEYRTTLIKQEILKRLGLHSAPNISHIPHLPRQMVDNMLLQTTNDAMGDVAHAHKQIILMAEQDSSRDAENSKAGQFLRFHSNIKRASITSATLVLRRNPEVLTKKLLKKRRLLNVRIINSSHPSVVGSHPKIIESSRNWIKLDVTSILKNGDALMTNVTIEVTCKKCAENGKVFLNSAKRRPMLLLKVTKKTRTKRSTTCFGVPSQRCCLVKHGVRFSDMGWTFVIAPQVFYLNYCRGFCRGRGSQSLFLKRINLFSPQKKTNPNDNCCVVSKMLPLSIVYSDSQMNVVKVDIPNVTATDCQCA